MKTFYNVVKAAICCAKEARALTVLDIEWVQFVLQNYEKLQNYRFKVTRPSFFEGVPSYFEALWYPHLYFYRKSNT